MRKNVHFPGYEKNTRSVNCPNCHHCGSSRGSFYIAPIYDDIDHRHVGCHCRNDGSDLGQVSTASRPSLKHPKPEQVKASRPRDPHLGHSKKPPDPLNSLGSHCHSRWYEVRRAVWEQEFLALCDSAKPVHCQSTMTT